MTGSAAYELRRCAVGASVVYRAEDPLSPLESATYRLAIPHGQTTHEGPAAEIVAALSALPDRCGEAAVLDALRPWRAK